MVVVCGVLLEGLWLDAVLRLRWASCLRGNVVEGYVDNECFEQPGSTEGANMNIDPAMAVLLMLLSERADWT